MVKEKATVVALEGGDAWVETTRQSSCSSCESSSGCGTATFSKVLGNRPFRVRVTNPLHAKVGERVTIAVPENGLMRGAALLYMVPLLALFLSATAGEWVASNLFSLEWEWISILSGVAGAYGAVVWVRRKGWLEHSDMVPEIVNIDSEHNYITVS